MSEILTFSVGNVHSGRPDQQRLIVDDGVRFAIFRCLQLRAYGLVVPADADLLRWKGDHCFVRVYRYGKQLWRTRVDAPMEWNNREKQ